MSILLNLDEEGKGLSGYFPYDMIIAIVAAVGGYIAWRIYTIRLRRIKFEREARISRRRHRGAV